MASDFFQRLKEIFNAAMERPPGERAAFIDGACGGDTRLRRKVERMLAFGVEKNCFLEDAPVVSALRPEEPERLDRGSRIGKYILKRTIASGGMGTVYEAEQEDPRRTVAVKMLKKGLLFGSIQRRFEYEAYILAKLRHPNIARVIDAGFHDTISRSGADETGIPYFVMEYIPDAVLITDHVLENGLSLKQRLGLFLQVCDAVHHGHNAGIIHRDLKPSNILVDAHGQVKVIDFGVARAADADIALTAAHTEAGQLIGTVQYMSPEQCKADPDSLDIRSDVYSLGVVLYELLCGKLPYKVRNTTVFEAARRICEVAPEKPSFVKKSLRGDLETIILKALEKDRQHRYQNADELAADIGRFLDGKVIKARPAGLSRKLRKWALKNPAICAAMIVVVGIIGYVLLWSYPKILSEKNKTTEAYDQILRLADMKQLANLVAQAETLWPALPVRIGDLNTWIDQAEQLLDRGPVHRRTLDALRSDAQSYDEAARKRDRESHRDWPELVALRTTEKKLSKRIAELEEEGFLSDPTAGLKGHLARTRDRIRALEKEIARYRTWEFEKVERRWQHDVLADLTQGLDALKDPAQGLLRDILKRRESARRLEKDFAKHRAAWEETTASIADEALCPQYGGLTVKQKAGFFPLGQDPRTGLWEFAHLQTGEIPERGPDGSLAITEETGLVFVLIPGGSFKMGAIPPSEEHPLGSAHVDPGASFTTQPLLAVAIQPFLLSKYEMTQAQWFRFTGENPSRFGPAADFESERLSLLNPVEMVSWNDCADVLGRLGLRLPTESEWEYAARAGTSSIWWMGNDASSLAGKVNLRDERFRTHFDPDASGVEAWDDGHAVHAPVGAYLPNPFGLHDVCGNLSEWCQDNYVSTYNTKPADGSVYLSAQTIKRMNRGGNWQQSALGCTSAGRSFERPVNNSPLLGCRPAASLE